MRLLSIFLDECITLPGGYRVGLDPILGLLPGMGDLLGAILSFYVVYEASRLGIRKTVIAKMLTNIGTEFVLGSIPVAGDFFDATWKANMRNVRLAESAFRPGLRERNLTRVLLSLGLIFLVFFLILASVSFLFIHLLITVRR